MGSAVVVGAGIAGVRTVQGLVRRGHAGTITVIGAEHHPPYDRPPLSKEVLHCDARLPALLPAASEGGPNVEWWTGVTARTPVRYMSVDSAI
jgi:NADPH-dependent 2,4-dienoyl-CoA reductase/sulfur reductase-like enzyme